MLLQWPFSGLFIVTDGVCGRLNDKENQSSIKSDMGRCRGVGLGSLGRGSDSSWN